MTRMANGIISSGITSGTVVKFVGDERDLGPHKWRGLTGTVTDQKLDGWDVVVNIPGTGHGDTFGFDIAELEIVR